MALASRCAQVMTILASGLLKSEVHCRKISPGCRAIDVWSFKSQQFITQNLSRGLRDQNVSPIEHKEVDVVYEGGATFVITDSCLSATRRGRSTVRRKNRVGGLFNVPCDTFSASSWLFNLHARDSVISIFCSKQGERTWSAATWKKSDMRRSKSVRAGEDMALTKAAAWAWRQRATPGRLVVSHLWTTPPRD